MAEQAPARTTASGLEALIARLKEEGVAAGREEADRLVAEAQARALKLVEKAEADAKALVETARREAAALRQAGDDALEVAARDTILEVKDRLAKRFAGDVERAVSTATRDEELLRRMILEVVGRARAESGVDDAGEVEVVLPRTAIGLDELRRKPEELTAGSLSHFVAASAGEMLRAGVSFARADDDAGGLRLRLVDRQVTVDLSDRAVAEAILVHLQPRFRALLEGVVK